MESSGEVGHLRHGVCGKIVGILAVSGSET